MTNSQRIRRLLAATAILALVLTACGDDDSGADVGRRAAEVWAENMGLDD